MIRRRGGFTLTELVISLAILLVVVVLAGSVFMAAVESFALSRQLQDDQYNVRMALLSICQEAHRGVTAAYDGGALTLARTDGGSVVRYAVADGELTRVVASGTTPVAFTGAALTSMTAEAADGRLTVTVKGPNQLELKTQVMLTRVPAL